MILIREIRVLRKGSTPFLEGGRVSFIGYTFRCKEIELDGNQR